MDEALRLNTRFDASRDVIAKRVSQTVEVVQAGMRSAGEYASRMPYPGILEKLSGIGNRGESVGEDVHRLAEEHRGDDYAGKVQDLRDRQRDHPLRFVNEDARRLSDYAWNTMERTSEEVTLCIATVHIARFSQMFYLVDSMNALLRMDPMFRRALDAAGALAKSILIDEIGGKIPLFGTLLTVFDLMEPRIDRVTRELREAGDQMIRVLQFEDQLADIASYGDYVEQTVRLAEKSLANVRADFTRDTGRLNDLLA
jgi:hypothetical protein